MTTDPRIEDFRDMIWNAGPKGVTFREMNRHRAGRLPQPERDHIIRTLIEAGDIFLVEDVNAGIARGVKRRAYVYKRYIKDNSQQHADIRCVLLNKKGTERYPVQASRSVRCVCDI